MPSIGKLDRYIKILGVNKSRDSAGQEVLEFFTFYEGFSMVRAIFGKERFLSQREMAVRSYKFMVRYIDGVTEEMFIEYEGDYYDIVGLAPLGNRNRHWLEISCQYRKESPLVG